LPKPANVKLSVFDINGREISILVDEKLNAGFYSETWNGGGYSSGIYFYSIVTDEFSETKKMVLLK
jgi:hypothetical protein